MSRMGRTEPCCEKEVWRPVKNFEGCYEISSLGRVRSLPRSGTSRGGKILRGSCQHGYLTVNLKGNGLDRYFFVHRLVLETFVRKRKPKEQCRHLDGDPLNNQLRNLRWGTAKRNAADRAAHGNTLLGERHHKTKVSVAQVKEIRERRRAGESGPKLAREFGVSHVQIYNIEKGESWAHV